MESGAALDTLESGMLRAVGSAESPIVFTSAATDPLPGDWQCVRLAGDAAGSELRFVTFEYGGAPCEATSARYEGLLQVATPTAAVSDGVFRRSLTHGVLIQTEGTLDEFRDNTFTDNTAASVDVAAPQLLALGTGLAFTTPGDRIDVNTTFSLRSSGTWLAQPVPFRLADGLEIGGADVTIAAGARIELGSGSIVVFDSTLTAAGTEESPVTFTSARDPQAPGDWGCITFSAPSGTPSFRHAVVEYAGSGALCTGAEYETALHVPEDAVIADSTFRSIAGSAITSTECNLAQWCDNTFESVETGPLACDTGQMPTACP
jgi:hypothetical protein